MTRQHIGIQGRYSTKVIDLTRYVYVCLVCDWQVQAGYRARSDIGGHEALAAAIGQAAHDHTQEAHPDDPDAPVLVDEQGDRHHTTAADQGAIMAEPLPGWWVDR